MVVPTGARVFVSHLRLAEAAGSHSFYTGHQLRRAGVRAAAKGGVTMVCLELADGRRFYGRADCSPRDNYCKGTGRAIATGRALKNAGLA